MKITSKERASIRKLIEGIYSLKPSDTPGRWVLCRYGSVVCPGRGLRYHEAAKHMHHHISTDADRILEFMETSIAVNQS